MLKYLLEHGADPNLQNAEGRTPFFVFCGNQRIDIISELIIKRFVSGDKNRPNLRNSNVDQFINMGFYAKACYFLTTTPYLIENVPTFLKKYMSPKRWQNWEKEFQIIKKTNNDLTLIAHYLIENNLNWDSVKNIVRFFDEESYEQFKQGPYNEQKKDVILFGIIKKVRDDNHNRKHNVNKKATSSLWLTEDEISPKPKFISHKTMTDFSLISCSIFQCRIDLEYLLSHSNFRTNPPRTL